ncbi:MAG: hypothetical protein QXQ18_02020 [Candidatus Aenigmatarchaeota archaeon]
MKVREYFSKPIWSLLNLIFDRFGLANRLDRLDRFEIKKSNFYTELRKNEIVYAIIYHDREEPETNYSMK